MNAKTDKYLDDLSRKVIKGSTIESPSHSFTDAIMSQVQVLNKNQATVYKPLISKTTWILISVAFMAVICYALFSGNQVESGSWLSKIDFSALSNSNVSNTLSNFILSKTLMYAVVFFGIMFTIQITFLKHHFNKRLQ